MSIKVMTRVWEHAQHKESTLLILLALADFADDNGICWPEVPTLAAKARVSDRRATDIIQALEKDGSIVFKRGGGRGKRSLYGVLVGLNDEQKEKVKLIHRNYFTENKTVKPAVRKGELQRKEKVNYSVNSSTVSAQQDASNPDPIRQGSVKEPSERGNEQKKQAQAPARTPALLAYFEAYPNERLNADQVEQINSTVVDISKWLDVLKYWKGSGYRAQSIPKMLDRYLTGATVANDRPGGNGRHTSERVAPTANLAPRTPPPADVKPPQEVAARMKELIAQQRGK